MDRTKSLVVTIRRWAGLVCVGLWFWLCFVGWLVVLCMYVYVCVGWMGFGIASMFVSWAQDGRVE